MSSTTSFPAGYLEANNGGRTIAACTVILIITTILFPLRIYARSLVSAKRSWDDHVLVPAYIMLIGLIASVYAEVLQAGLGRHVAAIELENPDMVTKYLLLLYVLDWFYVPSNLLSRLSVVILYLRILTHRKARLACYVVMGFLIGNCVATIIAAQLECRPLAYTWDRTIPGGSCFNQILWYQVTNFPNIAGDVMIALLPIRTVWGIQASFARKAGIAAVCLTGSIGMIASCIRTSVFYLQADVISNDPTFADEAFSWTVVECGMYFSAACLIGMRPLLSRIPTFVKQHMGKTSHIRGQSGDATMGQQSHGARFAHIFHNNGTNGGRRTKNKYASMADDVEAEAGLRLDNMSHNVTTTTVKTQPTLHSFPTAGQEYRDVGNRDIRVQTSIEIERDWPPAALGAKAYALDVVDC